MKRLFLLILLALGCAARQTPPRVPPVREHPSLAEVVVGDTLSFSYDWIKENCELRGRTAIVAADYNEADQRFDEMARPKALELGANYVQRHDTRTWPGAVFYSCRVSASK
jgi:hypothetical protein